MTAAFLNIKNIYLPQVRDTSTLVPGVINLILTLSIIISVIIILINAVPNWFKSTRKGL